MILPIEFTITIYNYISTGVCIDSSNLISVVGSFDDSVEMTMIMREK